MIWEKVERKILGSNTWAMEGTEFSDRLNFFKTTALWPGSCSRESTIIFLNSDIQSALLANQPECAEIKIAAAKRIGIEI